jgi:20S proteasome subunit beta 3
MKSGKRIYYLIKITLKYFRFGPWFCEPVVAGLDENNSPYLASMDLIGAPMFSKEFVVSGTCKANLHGTCEALFRPDMVHFFIIQSFNF